MSDEAVATRPAAARAPERITLRSFLIGLALSVVFSFIVPYVDVYMSCTFLGSCHLPPGAVFMLLALVLVVNPLLRLIRRRWALSRAELLMIYCMLLFSLLVPGHGAENVFQPVIVSPFYYASVANGWEQLFFSHIPDWFAPTSERAITGFFEGLRQGEPIPWGQWLRPLLAWSVYSLAVYALVLFLSALFRAQWADYERISFPLVELPMRMVEHAHRPFARGSFYRHYGMWIGFGVAVFLSFMNGMNFYFPQWPAVALKYDFRPWGWGHPWRAVGWIPGRIWPAVVGTTVLLRTEVALSLWLFYWFNKAQLVMAAAVGFHGASIRTAWGYPQWLGSQPVGAHIAYVGFALWTARTHLRLAWRRAVGKPGPEPAHEPIPYGTCVWGILISLAVMTGWTMAAGAKWWVAAGQTISYVILAMALTKVVAEAGMLFVQSTLSGLELVSIFAGQRAMGVRSLTVGMFIERGYMTDLRAFVMPSYIQSFKIGDLARLDKRRIAVATSITVLVATIICYYMNLKLVYTHSGLACNPWFVQGAGPGGFRLLEKYIRTPVDVRWQGLAWTGAGAGFMLLLFLLRQRFAWFPLHPVGYIMTQSYAMSQLWFSVLIGWACKSIILRYGGPKGVTRALPVFLGIAFGDILMMVVWLIVDAITGTHGHYLMPG